MNGNLAASVRILELNLADAYQKLHDQKKLPVEIISTQPRPGGLCEGIFSALRQRAGGPDQDGLFAQNTLTLFQAEKKLTYNNSVTGRDVFVVFDYALPDARKVSPEFYLLAQNLASDAYITLAQQAGHAAKSHSAAHVHLIMPEYAYARQDKDHKQLAAVGASITAQNLEPYYDSVTSVHLHAPAIKGMFRSIPLNEISPNEIYTPRFVCRDAETLGPIPHDELTLDGVNALFSHLCIVSPDAGGAANARDFAKYCKKFASVMLEVPEDQITDILMAQIDKRRFGANASETMAVLGKENITDRHAVIVDDMGDTFGTATHAADALKKEGAKTVEFWGTHGYFSGPAMERIEKSGISRVNITNSRAQRPDVKESPHTNIIDISPIFAQVIIDQVTKPDLNLLVSSRHLKESFEARQMLGRHVFAMMGPSS